MQVAQSDRGANTHHHKHFGVGSSCLASSMADRLSKNGRFFGRFCDDRPENLGRSLVCQVGVFNEVRCSSLAFWDLHSSEMIFPLCLVFFFLAVCACICIIILAHPFL